MDNLTVPILLGSLFISHYVKALLPPERIIVLWNGVDEGSAVTMSLAEDAGKALKQSYMLRSTQDFVVLAMTENRHHRFCQRIRRFEHDLSPHGWRKKTYICQEWSCRVA